MTTSRVPPFLPPLGLVDGARAGRAQNHATVVVEQRGARDPLFLGQFLHEAERNLLAAARRLDLAEQGAERDGEPDRGEQEEQRQRIAQGDTPDRLRELGEPHQRRVAPVRESRADGPRRSRRVTVRGRLQLEARRFRLEQRTVRRVRGRRDRLSCLAGSQKAARHGHPGRHRRRTAASVTRARRNCNVVHKNDTCRPSSHSDDIYKIDTSASHFAFTKTKHRSNLRPTVLRPGMVLAQPHRSRERVVSATQSGACSDSTTKSTIRTREQRSYLPVRAHRTLILSLILALALAIPATALAKQLIIGGSTSVLPLGPETGQRLPQGLSEAPHAESRRRPVGHRHQRRRNGPLRHRRLLAQPDPRRRPERPRLHEDRPRRRSASITSPQNKLSNLSQQTVDGIFTGAIRDWSQVPGAQASGPIDLFDRDGASGTQDAFQHIFLGETLKISPSATEETSNGLEQNAVKNDRAEPDRLRLIRLHGGRQRGRLPGRRRARCATPSPASTAACVTSGW